MVILPKIIHGYNVSSVQLLSRVQLFATPWIAARQGSLSITNSWSSPKPMSIESVMSSSHLILCRPLLLLLQSFPASGSFQISQLFASCSQSIGVSASTSVLPINTQDWSPLGWTGWISLQSKELSRVFFNITVQNYPILLCSASAIVQLSHSYTTTGKTIALTRWTFVGKAVSLLFNMLSRLVITFLPRSKHLLMSFNFMAAVTICSDFGAQKKIQPLFPLFPHLFAMKWWDQMPWS